MAESKNVTRLSNPEIYRCYELEEKRKENLRQLRHALEDAESVSKELTDFRSNALLKINELQEEKKRLEQQVNTLHIAARSQLEERNDLTYNAKQLERKYEAMMKVVRECLCSDGPQDDNVALLKLQQYFVDDAKVREKLTLLEAALATAKEEANLEKEIHKTTLSQLERTKEKLYQEEVTNKEKEAALQKQKQLEDDLHHMGELLVKSQQRHDNVERQLKDCQLKMAMNEEESLQQNKLNSLAASMELMRLKECLVGLLSGIFPTVEPTEDSLKEKITKLLFSLQESKSVSDKLKEKLGELSRQFEDQQASLQNDAAQSAKKAEDEALSLNKQLKLLDSELKATEFLKESAKADKEKYVSFCHQLARIMKADEIVAGLGMELNGQALLIRAEQLANTEIELISDKRAHSEDVQRQLGDAKRQLAAKDLHIDVMRKKMSMLEEDNSHKAERDLHEVVEKNKRLKQQVEKLERQLKQTADATVTEEKVASLKRINENQRKKLLELEEHLAELETVREKESKTYGAAKWSEHERQNVQSACVEEMSCLKHQLAIATQREKQLLDFQRVIARMLGLHSHLLAVPDYEIIRRLEIFLETYNEMTLIQGGKKPVVENTESGFISMTKANTTNHPKS